MKKLLLSILAGLAVLAAGFTYVLYTEGFFDKHEAAPTSDLEPFMKCESGKCATGKCGSDN
ncbi:MAG: hypothetical protein GQ531_07965 [Sulfurovum sp.]|nr:hypothetical protein [Sulfurovum sp.]